MSLYFREVVVIYFRIAKCFLELWLNKMEKVESRIMKRFGSDMCEGSTYSNHSRSRLF